MTTPPADLHSPPRPNEPREHASGSASKEQMPADTERDGGLPGKRQWLWLALGGLVAGACMGVFVVGLSMGPPLVMASLGGMTLGLAALALWRVLDPLSSPRPPAYVAPSEPVRVRDMQREKVAVLKAIKEVRMDYEMRKISEADFKELEARYRARAMRLIAELEAGDNYRALIEQELKYRLAADDATRTLGKTARTPDTESESSPAHMEAARAHTAETQKAKQQSDTPAPADTDTERTDTENTP